MAEGRGWEGERPAQKQVDGEEQVPWLIVWREALGRWGMRLREAGLMFGRTWALVLERC